MSSTRIEQATTNRSTGIIRGPQAFAAGLTLLALTVFALWAMSDLAQGTLSEMGPGMLPRSIAIAVGLCGLALTAMAFLKPGERLERWSLRGPVFVLGAILAFAVTLRPFSIGALTTPGLGLVIAGPLAIIIGGYATPEARLRDLLILALTLTPFCMVLFGDLLNLPIPIFAQAFANLFPADWSQKAILRATAGVLVAAAVLVLLLGRHRRGRSIDVADHSGRI